jgi:hypothetical protein
MHDRLVKPAHTVQSKTHIAMKIGDSIVAPYGPAKEIERQLVTPVVERNEANEMQAVGVIGLDRENFPVSLLGLTKPPGLVQGHRILERIPDIDRHAETLESSLVAMP